MDQQLNILVLADRDWTHPEAGGTGTTFRELISRWIASRHHVTMITGSYPGACPFESPNPLLEIHRMGNRLTVFPLAAKAVAQGIGREADVVLEMINGITFFTPLWPTLRAPAVAMVQHVHQEHYVQELGWRGRAAGLVLERLPLRHLYRNSRFCTISHAALDDLVDLGVPEDLVDIVYLGAEAPSPGGPRAESATLLYLGRLKRYKRLEMLLDVLAELPGVRLEVAGEGDHRDDFEAEVARRGLGDRVIMHGFVPEEVKAELYARAWVNITTSAAEGWGLTVMEAASHATPSAALRVGGLAESIVDGDTGVLADDISELTTKVAAIIDSPELRERLGAAAALRAQGFSWDVAAAQLLAMLVSAAEARPRVNAPWRPFPAARPKRMGGTREPLVMEHGEPLVADSVNDS